MATMTGYLPTQALAFLRATHATQAIAFEWKPGCTVPLCCCVYLKQPNVGAAIFDNVAKLIYNLLDNKRYWKSYLAHVKLIPVPSAVSSASTQQPSDPSSAGIISFKSCFFSNTTHHHHHHHHQSICSAPTTL